MYERYFKITGNCIRRNIGTRLMIKMRTYLTQEEECEESNEDDWKIDIDDGDGNDDIPEETAIDDDEKGRPRNRFRIC